MVTRQIQQEIRVRVEIDIKINAIEYFVLRGRKGGGRGRDKGQMEQQRG